MFKVGGDRSPSSIRVPLGCPAPLRVYMAAGHLCRRRYLRTDRPQTGGPSKLTHHSSVTHQERKLAAGRGIGSKIHWQICDLQVVRMIAVHNAS